MTPTNIFVVVSLIINAILIVSVVGIVPFFLFLSVVANVASVFFIKGLFDQQEEIGLDTSDLLNSLEEFEKHLQSIYELETFYGDTTLKGLIEHMKVVGDDMEEYCRKHEFISIQEETLIAGEEDNTEETEE
tara:strand:+ start:2830 stop:3225 length:396 start_codon:yes stop_codon:yes gene_type:complete